MAREITKLNDIKNKIGGFVIDGDNKNRSILENEHFNIYRDPNHLVLYFGRYLTTELSKHKDMIEGCNDCFFGIRVKIEGWYSFLMYCNYDTEIKKYAWSSTVGHLIGDHSQCLPHNETFEVWQIGLDHPEVSVLLQEILDKRTGDFDQTVYGGTTNLNESFHKEQLVFDDKSLYFPVSQEIRDKLALLRHNEGPLYEIELRKRLKLFDISLENEQKIRMMNTERLKQSEFRSTPEFRSQEHINRKIVSEKRKKEKPGDYKRETDSD